MARKHPARKRRTPHRSATRRPAADHRQRPDNPLLEGLREALLEPNPVAFWGAATSVVVLVDEEPAELTDALPEGVDLLQTFIDVDVAETTALLHMVAAMGKNDLKRTRARRAVRERRQPVPPHVSGLAEMVVSGTEVFGDHAGDNHMLEVTLPGEVRVTLVAYVQRRPQPWLKDAFFVPDRLEIVEDRFRTLFLADGVPLEGAITALDPAQSRRALEDAIAGADVVPPEEPEEGDQWPMSRPLVEFVLSHLPVGGSGYGADGYLVGQDADDLLAPAGPDLDDDDWPDGDWLDDEAEFAEAVDDLAETFLASPHARALEKDAHDLDPVLAGALLSLAAMAEGDPLHWCEAVVRWVVEEALPRSPLLSHAEVVRRTAQIVPPLVAWAHEESGEDPEVVDGALAVLPRLLGELPDRWASTQMQVARRDGLTEIALMTGDPEIFVPALLQQRVGPVAIEDLDTEPLPDEPLALDEVPEDLHARLAEIDAALVAGLAEVTAHAGSHLGPEVGAELLTACRRLLVQVTLGDPQVLRGRAGTGSTAAAVAWLVGRGNALVGTSGVVRVKELMRAFGVRSTPSQRAESLSEAARLPRAPEGEVLALGSPRLLVASARGAILEEHRRVVSADQ